ncbi:group 1 truncated hemoglobin [Streptomyces sp. NBC_01591]|uniref:group I truncated hemoglobin n=1 Tax=Streptomyces sp. NBC_01591 TaxID=2975888 RepID=UPI002DD9E4B6|nr:group 1 truncated hemoglobin [Streptomyces sp. NBC_01591]WSD72895.1 group 1 truncated hemoglobin [Streptomyces sp. NBC_01591]
MTESAQTPSLYDRLGGTFGIAALMDVLTDRLYDNVSANRNPDVQKLHETNSRAGFKFMVTAWSIQETGGPQCYPGRDMREAHENMVATEYDFDVVALEIAATLSFCGVPQQEAKEYLDIIESYRHDVLTASAGKGNTPSAASA